MRLLCVALASVGLTLAACDGSGSSNATQNSVQPAPQSDAVNNQADDTANQANDAGNTTSDQTGDANTPGMYCELGGCQPGSNVITAAKSDGIFMSCETEQLSDYVNFVIGLLSAQKALTGTIPNIDPQTGEPEYEGASKDMLDNYRGKAGVETFDEATAHCQYGPYRRRVAVMNWHKDQSSTWVQDSKTSQPIWLPTNELDKLGAKG